MVARYALRLLVFSPRPWHEPDRCYATTQFVLEHLDGRKLLVSTPPGMVIKPGSLKGIRGEGMPIKGNRFDKVCRVPESAVGKRRAHVLACVCVVDRAYCSSTMWWTCQSRPSSRRRCARRCLPCCRAASRWRSQTRCNGVPSWKWTRMSRSVPHNAPVVRRTSLMTRTPTVAAVVVCSVRSSSCLHGSSKHRFT